MILIITLTKPPKVVLYRIITICWLPFVFFVGVDLLGIKLHWFYYTMKPLLFNLPIDLYLSGLLLYGIGVPIIFWWLKTINRKVMVLFVLALPFVGFIYDYMMYLLVKDKFVVIEKNYIFIIYFVAWVLGSYLYLFWVNIRLKEKSLRG